MIRIMEKYIAKSQNKVWGEDGEKRNMEVEGSRKEEGTKCLEGYLRT